VPPTAVGQPVVSGSVGDCLLLVPDGRKLDLFEVNLRTGDFFLIKTDLYVPDIIPLAFTRIYGLMDDWSRSNQIYLPHVYDPFLFGDRFPYTYVKWVLPDRQSIHYGRISPGTGSSDALYEHASPTPIFERSRAAWNGWGWDVSLEDGTTYLSPEAYSATRPQQGSLVGVFDGDGNEAILSRKRNGDLTEIKSPSGRWIRLDYDKGRIIRAKDNSGNVVEYDYDAHHFLQTVRDSLGQTTKYKYNSIGRITELTNPEKATILENDYDFSGRIIEQRLPDGSSYSFRYLADEAGNIMQADVIGPQSEVTRITFHGSNYSIEIRKHASPRR